MVQKKLPLINSAHGSETRNIINELIKLFNDMGYTYNESLQKAHDVLNEAERVNKENVSTQKQVDELILHAGQSDAEVIQARGGLPLLKDRLDESDAQLAQNAEQNNSEQINVMYPPIPMIGAKGDNDTDDTETIQNIANSFQNKVTLFFPKSSGFLTTDTIDFPNNVAVVMESPIIYSEDDNKIAIIVRSNAHDQKVMIRRKTVSDWSDENSIGVQFNTISAAMFTVAQASGFTIGAQFIGDGGGFAYNQIILGDLQNNKYAVDLTNRSVGWCNENLFINGRFWTGSAIQSGRNTEIYGVRITSQDGLYRNNNNNIFMKPSFEMGGNSIPIFIEHGVKNEFSAIRTEGNSGTLAIVKNASSFNKISIGIQSGGSGVSINDTSESETTFLTGDQSSLTSNLNRVFSIDNLHKRASYYNGSSSRIQIPRLFVALTTYATPFTAWSELGITEDYLTVSPARGIGRYVDAKIAKKFIIRKDAVNGFGGRINIICFDENGQIITDDTKQYVKGRPGVAFTRHNNFGGCYRTGSDYEGHVNFTVSKEVKKIAVILSGGTNELRIRGFSIDTNEQAVFINSWAGYENSESGAKTEIAEGMPIATAPPTEGSHEAGKIVYNAEPSPGGYQGWVCTTSGTPGTWKGFGLIQT